ncbi:MAG: hypothetical protein DI536_31215 [Archangium gephyra]|uniref:Uncharacterized protein n=1 Tax=Archangium gephyra TaxID=48 RepID=A0A2W5SZ57_9BACT|nr:MAG: hypothetical protein DI536_31215 [Archangium gephyra]
MRFVVLALGLAIVGYLGYRSMYGGRAPTEENSPKKRLENVQNAANRIEKEQEEAARRALEKATPQE